VNAKRVLLVVSIALGIGACAGSPVSLTAQRGSSILIPIGPYHWPTSDVIIGFGRPQQPGGGASGGAWADPQRGELEFYVDDGLGAGEIFLLRATSTSNPSLASPYARAPGIGNRNTEVVALLDIPVDAPLGQQTLRYRNKQDPSVSISVGSIWVLPREVLLCEAPSCGAPSGTPVVTGQPSPFVVGGSDISGVVKRTKPDPQLIIPFPVTAHAVELNIVFPVNKGQIVDVYENRSDRSTDLALTSLHSCSGPGCLGSYTVKAVAAHASGIDSLALVFQLSGSTPVNLGPPGGDVIVFTIVARDQFGNPIEDFPEFPGQIDRTTFFIQ